MARDRPDPIRVVEAAYAWEPDERAWLRSVVDASVPYDVGAGVAAFVVSASDVTHVTAVTSTASDEDTSALRDVLTSLTPALAHQALQPTEFVGNGAYRFSRIARSIGGDVGAAARVTLARMPTVWALISGDVTKRALVLCFPRHTPSSPEEAFPHADSRLLGLAGAHIGAALRLRALAAPHADDANTEAVISPNGKVLHATGDAATDRGRESLAKTVLASQHVRRNARTAPREETMREWTALVHGRWTIIETIERDGKRLVLARRNRMQSRALIDLTDDERDVVWLAAAGHTYKYISYELGLPIGTVSGRLRRAMKKLRVSSRVELLQKLGVPREE